MIWGNISRSVNGENVLGGVAYKIDPPHHGFLFLKQHGKGVGVRAWRFGSKVHQKELDLISDSIANNTCNLP